MLEIVYFLLCILTLHIIFDIICKLKEGRNQNEEKCKENNGRRTAYRIGTCIAYGISFNGVPQPGQVFLPMHIPVLLGGFVLGPVFGFFVGLFSPIISSVLTGMPAVGRLPFMMIELAVYGLVSGLMYNTFKFNKKKMGTYISLLTAMLCGRIVYAISLFVAVNLMGIQCGGPIAAVTATVSGVPGIIIQVLIIPPVVYALERSGYIDRHFRICKGTVA